MAALLLVLLLLSPAADAYISRGFFELPEAALRAAVRERRGALRLRADRLVRRRPARGRAEDAADARRVRGGLALDGLLLVARRHRLAAARLLHGGAVRHLLRHPARPRLLPVRPAVQVRERDPHDDQGRGRVHQLHRQRRRLLHGGPGLQKGDPRRAVRGHGRGPRAAAHRPRGHVPGRGRRQQRRSFGCSVLPVPGVCSAQAGMHCHSAFIRDTNAQQRYEGRTVYVLQSSTDELVGYRLCGKHAAEIEGANRTVTLFGFEHLALCTITPFQQYNLIHKGSIL
ncbi:hypothetical protein M3Y99_00976200 [Aphelenchoides fujianensis]|nr:hypothetical protein M3Y99_00976200 [Aphelenchoides fujianensis]